MGSSTKTASLVLEPLILRHSSTKPALLVLGVAVFC